MLGNKAAPVKASGVTTLVSRNTTVTGSIQFTGTLEIEGVMQGNIIAEPGKDAVVRVLGKGRVEGEIRAPWVIIDGTVKGDVHASAQLQLASKARVDGNVYYHQAEMSAGAEVNGTFQYVGDKGSRKADEAGPKGVAADTRAAG